MTGILAICVCLALLMFLAYRGVTLLILAPAMAALACLLMGDLPIIASYTQIFMSNMADFMLAFFPLFLLGAVFGKLMDDSGSASAIANGVAEWLGAEKAILAIVLCCAVLTYGGVSLFVVAFAIFPVAAALFQQANIPKRFIPATIGLGAFTFTMSALPGTPAIQNAIPMPFFGTTAFAAPGLGILAAVIMLAFGMWWLNARAGRAAAVGEGYQGPDKAAPADDTMVREGAHRDGFDLRDIEAAPQSGVVYQAPSTPGFALAIAPVVLVILVNFVSAKFIVPGLDTSYLAKPLFGETSIEAVQGIWAIITALIAANLFVVVANWNRLRDIKRSLDGGANASVIPIANTASLVGFGGVIAALPAFALISEALIGLAGGNPIVSLAVAVNVLSALTGSASGGMSIALDALGPTYAEIAIRDNISLEAMHRVTSIASGALDTLPHNGAVITVLGIAGVTHKDAYGDIFMTCIVGPMLAVIAILVAVTVFGAA